MRKIYSPSTWFQKAVAPEAKSYCTTVTVPDALAELISGGGGRMSPHKAFQLYSTSTAVSVPVNYIAEAFASINPVVVRDGVVMREHPVLQLLQRPSPYFTQDLFFEVIAKHYLVTGEAFVVGVGNISRPPIELQPVQPQDCDTPIREGGIATRISVSGDIMPGTYAIDKKPGGIRYIRGNLAEIRQLRNFSVSDASMLRGQSPLAAAAAEVRQHIQGNMHNVALLENGGRVSLVFHFAEDLDDDDFDLTRERVVEQYGGTTKAGSIGVTAGGKLEIKEIGVNNRDMDFANLHAVAKQAVALQYKFPLPLLTTDASTLNNYQEAKTALFDDAVLPLADRIFGFLTDFLMPRFNLDPTKDRITYDEDQITALKSRRNEELKLRKDLNIESVNELRALLGREPAANGDQILVSGLMIPLASDIYTEDNKPNAGLARDGKE